jgi:hypothetical protein
MRKIPAFVLRAVVCATLATPTFAGTAAKAGRNAFISVNSRESGRTQRLWHYIVTHKEVLAGDAIAASAWSADAASTLYDTHHCLCVEQNPLLGPHPSERAILSYGIGAAAVQITLNHLIWHYAPEHLDRHLIWFEMAPLIGAEAQNVYSNVKAADMAPLPQLQNANMRVSYGVSAAPPRFFLNKR